MTNPSIVAQIMAMRLKRMTFTQIGEALQPPLSTAGVREILRMDQVKPRTDDRSPDRRPFIASRR